MNFERSDSLRAYFREISRYQPLSTEEEQALAQRIVNGDKRAVEKIITHNLLIVVKIANRHVGQGVPIDDLIQEGNLALKEAAEAFKPSMGSRFIRYASLWIRKRLNETVVKHGRIVRLPHNQEYDIYKAKMAGAEYFEIQKVEIDAPFGEDGHGTLGDMLLRSEPEVDHSVERDYQVELSGRLVSLLKDRDREIISAYFGLEGGVAMDTAELATAFDLSRTRVSQIIKSSLETMRAGAKNIQL